MTIAKQVEKLIKAGINKYQWSLATYCYYLPDFAQEDVQDNIALITEVNAIPTNYGSDHSTLLRKTVAINIFYGLNSATNFDVFEQQLITLFEDNGWSLVYSPGHTIDPDTKQVTKIFHFATDISRTFE